MITTPETKTYTVQVSTSRNNWFVWEIEDDSVQNLLARVAPKLQYLSVEEIKIEEVK